MIWKEFVLGTPNRRALAVVRFPVRSGGQTPKAHTDDFVACSSQSILTSDGGDGLTGIPARLP